jgi:CII-binding regulator of phage lambda lysogenization HflD
LIQQSDFYLSEIEKVYNDYQSKGGSKKTDLLAQKQHENESLVGELSLLKQQLEAITTQIADKENKLSVIDVKYAPMLSEVEGKLAANEIAKTKIAQSIEQVKQGIINNLK